MYYHLNANLTLVPIFPTGAWSLRNHPLVSPVCQSKLHLPPTWWRFLTKVTSQSITHTKDTTKARFGENEIRQHLKDTTISSHLAASHMDHSPGRRQWFIQLKKTTTNWKKTSVFLRQAVFHSAAFCSEPTQVVSTASGSCLPQSLVLVSCWIHRHCCTRARDAALCWG